MKDPAKLYMAGIIKSARQAKGWTIRNLATKADVSYQAVIGWESGRSAPRLAVLFRVCRILDIKSIPVPGND